MSGGDEDRAGVGGRAERAPGDSLPDAEGVGDTASSLSAALPRALIAEGLAEPLAQRWLELAAEPASSVGPAIPRWPLDRSIQNALFDARRARRLVRGLEGAAEVLATEEAGLQQARGDEERGRRISRLLVVTEDGSARFYRQVERMRSRYRARLEVFAVDVDDQAFGAALFGRGKRVRAVLVTHKDPVVRILRLLAGAMK